MKRSDRIDDEELIRKILQNDKNALGQLYSRYFKKVFHKCLSFIKDPQDASDLAQETLLKALKNLNSFRFESSFSTWLYIICHRYCIESLRKKNKTILLPLNYMLEDTIISDADYMDNETELAMLRLINNLPENDRNLLVLKYGQGESIESLHHKLNLTASAIKMRLKRCKEKLNQQYNEFVFAH